MTNFTSPLYVTGPGGDTGVSTTDTKGYVTLSKSTVGVSAASRSTTITVPPNSILTAVSIVITSAVAGIAAGVSYRAGTVASPSLYGIVGVSAEGVYSMVLTKQCVVGSPTTVVIDCTAQASAAELTTVKGKPRIGYGVRA